MNPQYKYLAIRAVIVVAVLAVVALEVSLPGDSRVELVVAAMIGVGLLALWLTINFVGPALLWAIEQAHSYFRGEARR
jgi:uncharacterized membrane protein